MFWQIASIVLQVVQLGLYITALEHYKDKLEEFADWLCDSADDNRDRYLEYRECDPDFYDYYKSLPDYTQCDSNVKRSKGAAYHGYGSRLRRSLRTTRGYTPMTKVHLNNMLSSDAIAQTALTRATQRIKERRYEDNHVLARWSAIVSAPIGVERYYTGASTTIIQESFRNLKALGQGFNSAAAAFGSQLFRVLN